MRLVWHGRAAGGCAEQVHITTLSTHIAGGRIITCHWLAGQTSVASVDPLVHVRCTAHMRSIQTLCAQCRAERSADNQAIYVADVEARHLRALLPPLPGSDSEQLYAGCGIIKAIPGGDTELPGGCRPAACVPCTSAGLG